MKDAAATKAGALKEQAMSTVSDITSQAAARASDVFSAGFDQVTGVVADLNAAMPVVRKAGYSLSAVTLNVSLTPQIVASFKTVETLTDEQAEAIEREHADSKLALMMIRALRRATKVQTALSIGGLKPEGLAMSIGLSPAVSIQFG